MSNETAAQDQAGQAGGEAVPKHGTWQPPDPAR